MSSADAHLAGFSSPALAAAPGAGDVWTLFIWFALAAVIALGGFYVAMAIRRWTQRDEHVVAFTFQDLRDMRARGQINEQEFAAMRAALLSQLDLSEGDEPAAAGRDRPGGLVDPPTEQSPPPPDEDVPPPSDPKPPAT